MGKRIIGTIAGGLAALAVVIGYLFLDGSPPVRVAEIAQQPETEQPRTAQSGTETPAETSGSQARSGSKTSDQGTVVSAKALPDTTLTTASTEMPAEETPSGVTTETATLDPEKVVASTPARTGPAPVDGRTEKPATAGDTDETLAVVRMDQTAEPAEQEVRPVVTVPASPSTGFVEVGADPIPEPSADEPEDPAQPSVPASSVLAAVDPAGSDAVVTTPAPDQIRRGDASSTGITTPEPVVPGTAPRIGGTPSGTASPRPDPSGLPVQDGSSPSIADRDERIARHDAAVPATALPGADRKADPGAPSFDLVRVSPDGQTVIAGRAMPDQVVEILIGGQLVEEVRADRNGQFVSVLFANAATEPRSLELRTLVPNEPEPADTTVPAVTEDAERAVDLSDGDPAPLTTNPEAPRGTEVPENAVTPDIALSGPAPQTPGSDDGSEPVVGGQADPAIAGTPLGLAAAEAPSLSSPGASSQTHQTARSGSRYAVSAPVIILPAAQDTDVPTLVELDRRDLKLLQPSDRDIRGVVLDSITYGETGDVILSGRGIPPRAIRIYANAVPVGIARVGEDGVWTYALPEAGANDIKLFRMDEIDDAGGVTSRVEAPFQYRRFSPQVLRERRVVVQRGDALWRIAEQYYGEGIRYSMIYGANTELIRDPDLIYPGQVFSIPELVDAN